MLSSGVRTAVRVALVVLAGVISVSTLASLGFLAFGLGSLRVITDTQALPANVRVLTVDTGDVPVVVRLTTDVDAKAPRVDLRIATSTKDTRLVAATDDAGSRVSLRDGGSGLLRLNIAGELKVVLPPAVAHELSVTVNQRAGSLSTDSDVDQLVANTHGLVTLGGSARRINVNVDSGDIKTSDPIAVTESFTADTKNGAISVAFRVAPRTTETIARGNVTVRVPVAGPYRVRAESEGGHGETSVTVAQTSDPSAPEVTARSRGANVTVTASPFRN